jgi:hypothetical protein
MHISKNNYNSKYALTYCMKFYKETPDLDLISTKTEVNSEISKKMMIMIIMAFRKFLL